VVDDFTLPRTPVQDAEDAVRTLLKFIGEDATREGLQETPARVVRAYAELFGGYKIDHEALLKVFTEGSCDEMVLVKEIEFSSTCEHHMLPFIGSAHVAYLPQGKVVGVSKLARLVEVFARRLQIQERMTSQIADALMDCPAKPLGVACVIEAKHLCMVCRGVRKQSSIMQTSALRGEFLQPEVRAEFFSMLKR